jgi:hypothetical protein
MLVTFYFLQVFWVILVSPTEFLRILEKSWFEKPATEITCNLQLQVFSAIAGFSCNRRLW